jgi:hypothetical protein
VLVLDEEGIGALQDGTFIERVLRLAAGQSSRSPLALHVGDAGKAGWFPMREQQADQPFGLVAEGHYYLDWSRAPDPDATDIAGFGAYLESIAGTPLRWKYATRTSPEALIPLARFGPSRPPPDPPSGPLETTASEVERGFRHHEALPLFMPAAGLERIPCAPESSQDGRGAIIERAWSEWLPPRSRELHLLVDIEGHATLVTEERPAEGSLRATQRGPALLPVGLLWELPFPRTACLSWSLDPATNDVVYAVTPETPSASLATVLGYLPVDFLPGRVPLARALEECAALVQGPEHVTMPPLTDLSPPVYVEPSGGPPTLEPANLQVPVTPADVAATSRGHDRTHFGLHRRKGPA